MEDSIFTRIIKGELPGDKVYEDDKTLVIMDIYPIQPGQVIVIPKKQVATVWDMEPEDYTALMDTVQKTGKRMREIFPDKKRVGVIVEGLGVPDHAHVKVFAFNTSEEFTNSPDRNQDPDNEAIAAMAKTLAF